MTDFTRYTLGGCYDGEVDIGCRDHWGGREPLTATSPATAWGVTVATLADAIAAAEQHEAEWHASTSKAGPSSNETGTS